MNTIETKLNGCFVIEPRVFNDDRGYFFESYNKESFDKVVGSEVNFVQDNESYSTKGVLRGLHFQKGDYSQAKLVRVTHGKVLDVAVDLRPDSDTFLQVETVVLSSENKKQLFVPRGFAHGFIVLSDTVVFNYKCDNSYNKDSEGGIIYNDPTLNIDWILNSDEFIVSEKDTILPTIKELF
jgi:dTDP-4-dehydrorhamnose 3,5-epimerase